MNYQDIHLEDKVLWNQLQTAWEQGDYTAALNVLKNASLTDKQLNAAVVNAVTAELTMLQNQKDADFKTDKIKVATEPSSDLVVGEVYFKNLGAVTDYNVTGAYYIEPNQKTSSGYDVLNYKTHAEKTPLSTNVAHTYFGDNNVSLDTAIYQAYQAINSAIS